MANEHDGWDDKYGADGLDTDGGTSEERRWRAGAQRGRDEDELETVMIRWWGMGDGMRRMKWVGHCLRFLRLASGPYHGMQRWHQS